MDYIEFVNNVDADPELRGLAVEHTPDSFKLVVEHKATKLVTVLMREAIVATEWDILHSILTGEREPVVLSHMSRVVGYYSRVENWNPSKIGELHDRHKGIYSIGDGAVML